MKAVQTKKEDSTSTAMARRAPVEMTERGFALNDLDSAIRFANGLIQGGMVPKGVTQPGAVVGLIQAGKELGLNPMYALANLTFTNGRLGIMGDAAKALIRGSGALEPGTDFGEVYEGEEGTPSWKCTVTAHRRGQPQPFSASFSVQDAITAKLVRIFNNKIQSRTRDGFNDDGPWATYTRRMLMYRALGFLCRDRFSDILGGAVLQEELRDYPRQDERATPMSSPLEPDPLLSDAPDAEAPVIEADVVTSRAETPPPAQTSDEPHVPPASAAPPDAERQLIADTDRLEGRIVTAESIDDLDRVWTEAKPILDAASTAVRKRLHNLYEQNAQNFEK